MILCYLGQERSEAELNVRGVLHHLAQGGIPQEAGVCQVLGLRVLRFDSVPSVP